MQILSGLREADDSTAALIDLVQHLLERGLLGQAPQFTSEVPLQRLPAPLGATLKRSVHIIGDIANEHIHAYKMLSRGLAGEATEDRYPRFEPVSSLLARTRFAG